jgi:hypothetical protein
MAPPMILSRIKSLLPGRNPNPARRRFRDTPVRNAALVQKKKEVAPIRLIGYFVGGILLANLVLMTSSAFRGHAAQPAQPGVGLLKRGPVAAAENDSQVAMKPESAAQPDAEMPDESEPEQAAEIPQPLIANICADAREKLISGLTIYYLQRSRRPAASVDEVLESAGAITLLSGPADPASLPTGIPCSG